MKKGENQVQLSKLVFTQNWEDPECDYRALRVQSGDTVVAVTSGGCNVLSFLRFNPETIYSLDINAAQSFLLELKIAAMRVLEFDDFRAFSGLTACPDRQHFFNRIREHLSPLAAAYWEAHPGVIRSGFIMQGRYDRFVALAGRILKLLQGRKRIERLMEEKTLEQQHRFYDEVWNTRRYRAIYKLLFNKYVLAKKGLSADYFHFDDGSTSFAESFYKRARNAFRDLPIKGNYFLSLYVTGRYANPEEVPDYLNREYFELIRSRLDRINILTTDAQGWLDGLEGDRIDCFALSNICELMSESETERLFRAVYRVARPGARVIFRNLIIPREVPDSMHHEIIKDHNLSQELMRSDRSFVYGKVAAYTIHKGS